MMARLQARFSEITEPPPEDILSIALVLTLYAGLGWMLVRWLRG